MPPSKGTTLDEAERLLLQLASEPLDEADRTRLTVLIQTVAHLLRERPAGRGVTVVKTEGVCGGRACVGDTRIPVWSLVAARRLGISDEQLLADYPSLSPVHLTVAWAYHAAHRDEIEHDIAEQDAA